MKKIFFYCSILMMVTSCTTMNKPQAILLDRWTRNIDSLADELVREYGTTLESKPALGDAANSLRINLDSLSAFAVRFKNPSTQLTVQRYLAHTNSLLLLSQNEHLNLLAFSSELSSLNKTRAGIRAKLSPLLRKRRR